MRNGTGFVEEDFRDFIFLKIAEELLEDSIENIFSSSEVYFAPLRILITLLRFVLASFALFLAVSNPLSAGDNLFKRLSLRVVRFIAFFTAFGTFADLLEYFSDKEIEMFDEDDAERKISEVT